MGRPRTRTVKDSETGAQALLTAIWNHFGGPKAVADLCGVKLGDVLNWEVRGKVSLEYVAHVTTKLIHNDLDDTLYFALNYIDVSLANIPSERLKWTTIVMYVCNLFKISKTVEDQILFLEPPKLPKLYKKV